MFHVQSIYLYVPPSPFNWPKFAINNIVKFINKPASNGWMLRLSLAHSLTRSRAHTPRGTYRLYRSRHRSPKWECAHRTRGKLTCDNVVTLKTHSQTKNLEQQWTAFKMHLGCCCCSWYCCRCCSERRFHYYFVCEFYLANFYQHNYKLVWATAHT